MRLSPTWVVRLCDLRCAPKAWFAYDSPVEGDGFEPSVPVAREPVYIAEGELRGDRRAAKKFGGVPMVRIHLPPADSLSLSRSLFRRSRTRLSARVWGSWLDDQVGRDAQVFRYGAKPQQYLCRAIFQYRSVADLGGENARTKSGLLQA